MKRQKANFTWSEFEKQNIQAEKVYWAFLVKHETLQFCVVCIQHILKYVTNTGDFTAPNMNKFTSIKAFNIARHVLNNPTSQIFINGLKKTKTKSNIKVFR